MDVAGGYGVTGHDKQLVMWQFTNPSSAGGVERMWERKADT